MAQKALDTAGSKTAEIDLSTRLAEAGRLGVTGSVDPFRELPFVDVAIRLENMPLRPFSPAAEPQLGFEIRSGRLTLDMPLRVEDGQLEGRLGANLDSFYLGDKVPSETASSLPIKLGLDLLRDAND